MSEQKSGAQNMDDSRSNSKTYETMVNQTSTLERIPSIEVGRDPGFMVFDSNPFNPNKIYVANWGSNTMSVIDGNNNTNINTIKVRQPLDISPIFSIRIPPAGLKSMVLNNGKGYMDTFASNPISVIDEKIIRM